MYTKTNGIILNKTKYAGNAVICSVYTLEYGKQSYIIRNSTSKKNKSIYLHPLQILEFDVNIKDVQQVYTVRKTNLSYNYNSIPFNVYKSNISVFIAQLLNSLIKEEYSNPDLYEFIKNSCLYLDSIEEGYANFHIFFIIKLCTLIGYQPINNYNKENIYFNLTKGCFISHKIDKNTNKETAKILHELMKIKIVDINSLQINRNSRNSILDTLIEYLEIHNDGKIKIKSLDIIREIFK